MKSYFFNAEPTTDLIHHPTGYDREYDADDQAAFWRPFFTGAGVFDGEGPEACRVVVEAGNTLRIQPGSAYVRGRTVIFDGTETITVTENCRIVARMNKTADVRAFQLLAVAELIQTEDVYDLELARVELVPITGGFEAKVTDTRTFITLAGVELLRQFEAVTVNVEASGWTGSGPWTQTLAVPGVVAWDTGLGVYPVDITDAAARKLYEKAYGCLAPEAETGADSVTLTCRDSKPETNFQVIIKGVR